MVQNGQLWPGQLLKAPLEVVRWGVGVASAVVAIVAMLQVVAVRAVGSAAAALVDETVLGAVARVAAKQALAMKETARAAVQGEVGAVVRKAEVMTGTAAM